MSKSIRLGNTLPLGSQFVVDKEAQQITYTNAVPQSLSFTNVTYNINIPSYTSSIGNIVTMNMSFVIPVTATNFGNLTIGGAAGPPVAFTSTLAQMPYFSIVNNPISSIIQTYTANIANQSVSQPMLTNLADAFSQYKHISWLTSNPDYENDFSEGITDVNSAFATSTTKTFGEDTPFCRSSSVRFIPTMPNPAPAAAGVVAITAGNLVVDLYQDFELLLGCGDEQLYGFSKLIVNLQYVSNIATTLIRAILPNGDAIPGFAFGALPAQPTSQFLYYRQCAVASTQALMYRCMTYNITTASVGPLAVKQIFPNDGTYLTTQNSIQLLQPETAISSPAVILDSIPYGFFIFMAVVPPADTPSATAAPYQYLPISNISINYMDKTSLLSASSQYALYKLCVENGLNCSFDRFRGKPVQTISAPATTTTPAGTIAAGVSLTQLRYNYTSSSIPNAAPLFIKSSDLSLGENQNAGQNIRSTFQCTVTYANNIISATGATTAISANLYIVPVTENMLRIDRDQAQLTNNWALSLPGNTQITRGGSTWDTLSRTLKNVFTLNVGDIVDQFKHSSWAAGVMGKSEIEQSKLF